jgi:signal transduction histidine kinase
MDMPMPGVEIHAQAFETIARGRFLEEGALGLTVLMAFLLAGLTGAGFLWLPSRWPYLLAGACVLAAHAIPAIAFPRGLVLAGFAPAAAAWFAALGCGSWQFFVVRRQLRTSEAERQRYQQAFHFVAHEMRTPLTAIQGSSELISRYNLPDGKRKELSQMINAESKRLARMITTFLDVERLNSGQMELRREPLDPGELVESCIHRARPLAENKQIRVAFEPPPEGRIEADRELLEYAVYNLVTNAIKYSPAQTEVRVSAARQNGQWRLSVRDQGIGMDEKEVKQIFHRFYRTSRAVQSGETGTGIGLSIVDQIVTQHGGHIDVQSKPDHGSCFTIVLPVASPSE